MEEVREILNKGSGRNKEDDKIGVMKWLIAVVFWVLAFICSNFQREWMFLSSSLMLSNLLLLPMLN